MPIFKSIRKGGIITLYPQRKLCLQLSYDYGFSTDFHSLQSKHNYLSIESTFTVLIYNV